MPAKKRTQQEIVAERFERMLRSAMNTPPDKPRAGRKKKVAKKKAKRKSAR